MSVLPPCMMPDGGESCVAYDMLVTENQMLRQCCNQYVQEIAQMADELAFWKHQAVWHRAYVRFNAPASFKEECKAEAELEEIRRQENAERYAHAEPSRDPGGT